MSGDENYGLGIDIGTTSVKVTVVDFATQKSVFSFSQKACADIASDVGNLGSEQDPNKIVSTLLMCLERIPKDCQRKVGGISVTGQMHGVMLWRSRDIVNSAFQTRIDTSHLYTWMDQRCTSEFLSTLPTPASHLKVSTGHGCATLFWLARNQGDIIRDRGYDCTGSVMDFVVSRLCLLEKPVTTVQVAASMGYCDTEEKSWNLKILSENGFPTNLLPRIVDSGKLAGQLKGPFLHFRPDIPVYAAHGDVQCAFLSVLENPSDAVLNISTSIQIGYIVKGGDSLQLSVKPATVEYFPYFSGNYIALSAGLNGGNVLQHFVTTVQSWLAEFGLVLSEDEIWSKLFTLAEDKDSPSLTISPTLFGERHDPGLKGSVSGITANNTSLGEIFKAACYGVVDNLQNLMPKEYLREQGCIKRILASGSVISRNPIICEYLQNIYSDIPIMYGSPGDSALGAAKLINIYNWS